MHKTSGINRGLSSAFSCEGVNKKNNVINKDKFIDVISSKLSGSVMDSSGLTSVRIFKLRTPLVIFIQNVKF